MNRSRPLRVLQTAAELSSARVLAASVAMLVNATICIPVSAQQRDSVDQRRLEAPIGHRQPRPRDLPPWIQQNENNVLRPKTNFDVGPDIKICRRC
jgi:hypothetical protein